MIYTAEQKQLLSQLDDSSKRLDKVRKQIQYLEDDLYAIEKDKQVVIGLLCDTGLEPEDL
jgi:septal ring factor EnvC (AmiA/AmiB activator)